MIRSVRIIAKNKEERDIFLIPPNFLNEGSLFGGMLKLRNTLEAVILVAGITIPILKITVFSFTAKTILLCLTALPIGIFALIGIGGESLTAFLMNFFRFLRNRKMLYRSDAMSEQEESRELSLQELAERLEVEKEELVLALESTKDVESLYASVDGNEGTLQLIDKLTDNTENEKVMERLSLMEALEHLDAKQRQIIILRYFQDRTQADVARCIGISQVQVSRIEKRVLSELRRHLQEKD